jgi:hypothetical protein
MAEDKQESSYLERLAALDLLRENILFSQPNKLNLTNSLEDLPGVFRSAAPLLKNIAPSAAIISKDPEERNKQINEAIKRIKTSKGSKESLGKEVLHNVTELGLKSIPLSFLLSSAFHIASPRNPFLKGKLRAPITPIRNIKRVLNDGRYAKALAGTAAKDSLLGAGLGATAGALYPLVSSKIDPSDSALNDAATILQNEPLITSLPPAEFLSVLKNEDLGSKPSKLRNIAIGTGAGLGFGGLGALSISGVKGLGYGASNLYRKLTGRTLNKNVLGTLSSGLLKDLKVTLPLGAGLGIFSGLNTKNLSDYAQQKTDTDQV